MAVGESWGRYPRARQTLLAQDHRDQALPTFEGRLLPYGNGRSYGDVCLNDGGSLLRTRRLDRYLAFDAGTGVLRCEAGMLLDEILALVVPRGWFLAVTPGTRFATVGGAIANDVHGKNHHVAGTFGHHLRAFELLRSNGMRLRCSSEENPDWFAATIGGLGLTGLVTWVELQLRRIDGPTIISETIKFDRLDDFFELSAASSGSHEYTVAWIDCAARGAKLGRGLFMRGSHAPADRQSGDHARGAGPSLPSLPFSLVNPLSLRVFNSLYWHRQWRHSRESSSHYEPFFYPLDRLQHWNRMYGPRGFLQYQCVVPPEVASDAIPALLARISASGTGSFLAVLKQFGNRPSPGMLSFPRPGTTLALDFPIDRNGRVFELLDRLDDVVSEAGGAVYPAKDARMSGKRFRQYFPAWQAFSAFIDPRFTSGFWRRAMDS
jgi:FAD/FMN-containing dehydrogenase